MKLKRVVDPLIKAARGDACEVCLSRNQLQVEYDIDIDRMADMYDQEYPGNEVSNYLRVFLHSLLSFLLNIQL